MKPKNFPARKLMRQIAARAGCPVAHLDPNDQVLVEARAKRTKINRSK